MRNFSVQDLFLEEYGLQAPFEIKLDGGEIHIVEKVLRYLPGKRLAFKMRYKGASVFAKLFSPTARGRQFKKEQQGFKLLHDNNINFPAIIKIKEFDNAQIIIQQWIDGTPPEFGEKSFDLVFPFLGKFHQADLIHNDLHIDNLIQSDNALYLLDAGAVEEEKDPSIKLKNLALFIAQFPLVTQQHLLSFLPSDEKGLACNVSKEELSKNIKICWKKRKYKYLKKIFRDCTQVKHWEKGINTYWVTRSFYSEDLQGTLSDIEQVMERGDFLKKGNSQTVVKINVDGKELVVKRFNQTSWRYKVRQLFNISRAKNCWKYAHLLPMVGINTPAPVAYIERRDSAFKGTAYYICEYFQAENVIQVVEKDGVSAQLLGEIKNLFSVLKAASLAHGDFKGTNVLVEDNKPYLIDLDAMRENPHNYSYLHKKDIDRFLENFSTTIKEILSEKLK